MMQQSDDEVLEKYGLQPDQLELGEVLSGDGAFGLVRNGTLHRGTGSSSSKVSIQPRSFPLRMDLQSLQPHVCLMST
jgi:hypothetical protein